MSKYVELEVKPEGASGSVLAIPLSSTGSDGKAKTWAVRDEKGATLLEVNSATQRTSLSTISGTLAMSGPLQFASVADDTERDTLIPTPATGMVIFNLGTGYLQIYNGSWSNVGGGL